MLRALILEDSPKDVEIIRELLIDAGFDLDMDCTALEKEFVSLLRSNTYDVILADFKLPGFDGFGALKWAKEICPNVPFICVSGTIGEETAVDLLKLGAVDYVFKDRPIRLPFAIKRALGEAKEKERQRQAEEELRKSELRFKQVTESAHEWVWEVDKNGLYTYVNPIIKELLGYEVEELIGIKYFYDFFDPENKEEMKLAALGAFARKENFRHFINRNIHKDGRKIILSTTGFPILDAENNLLGYRGVDVDITERLLAEEALLKLKKAVDNSGEVIFMTDKKGIFTFVNTAFTSIYGFTADEIVGKVTPRILKSGVEDANYYKLFWETLKGGKEKRGELINKRKDGTLINVEVSASPIFDEKNNIIGFLGIQRDITERKRAEEEIIMLAHSLKSINECVSITDMENKILFINESFLKTYGYDENELVGKNITIVRSLDKAPELVGEILPATLRGGWQGELWNKRKDGSEFQIYLSTTIINDKDGKLLGLIGVAKDITKRKRAEEEIIQIKEKMQMLVEGTPHLFFYVQGVNANIQYVSPSIKEITGRAVKQWIDQKHWFATDSPFNQIARERTNKNLNGEINLEPILVEVKHADGHPILLEVYEKPIFRNNKVVGLQGVAHDITQRKQAEEELKKKNTFIQTVLDNLPIGIALNEIDKGNAFYANKKFEEIYGWPIEEMKDISGFIEKVYPDKKYREELITKINADIQSGDPSRMHWEDCIVTHKDGSKHVVNGVNIPLSEQNTMVSTVIDITERKHAEETLKKSEESYRFIVESTNAVIYHLKYSTMKYDYINPAIEKLTGYSPEEINEIGFKNIILKINRYHVENVNIDLIVANREQGKTAEWQADYQVRTKDGRLIWLSDHSYPWLNETGNLIGGIGILVDITERKHAEEALRDSEQKYRLLFMNNPVPMWIFDVNSLIFLAVNDFAVDHYGYSREEFLSMTIKDIRPPEDVPFLKEVLDKITGRLRKIGDVRHRRKDGSLIEVEIAAHQIDFDGCSAMMVLAMDITKRKRAEKELIEAKEKAESANKLKDAFINNMSHEIRTPLNGILGLSSLIKENYARYVEKEDESLFTGIDSSAQRIIRTVDMILNYSRLQTGEFSVIPKQINLFEICELIIKQKREAAEMKSLEVLFHNRCDGTKITGDEYTITQIVSNLVENAIKYTKKGTVEIALSPGTAGGVTLEIIDTGIGIAEEYLEHLFEPYRQEEMGYGRPYEGVGLGLALTKKFVELNNAVLSVESKKGEGTTFRIEFDKVGIAQINEIDFVKKVETVSSTITKKETVILVVEDDLTNQDVINRILRKKYELFFAVSAEETYEVLKKNKIDLILMDISIQGNKDGLELTKELKGTKKYSHIPVIAVTAHAGNEDQRNALAAGCDEYLAKPFSMDQLFEKIGKFV